MKKAAKKKIKPKPFKGWDWSELSERWGIVAPKNAKDGWLLKKTQARILSVLDMQFEEKTRASQEYKDCRTYVKALIKIEHCYSTPLWTGLLEVKSAYEFMRYTAAILPYMWT